VFQVTLDTNCLLDLETENERTPAVRRLIARHRSGEIELRIPAISASERQREGKYLPNFSAFEARLRRLGLDGVPHLLPLCYFGIGFLNHCLLAGEELITLERRIHDILHPNIQFVYGEYLVARQLPSTTPLDGKWRNAKCDVQVMWSHIWHKGTVLVTNDRNFRKATKRPQLVGLGAGEIIEPLAANPYLDRAA
jgi:hypothetical protein